MIFGYCYSTQLNHFKYISILSGIYLYSPVLLQSYVNTRLYLCHIFLLLYVYIVCLKKKVGLANSSRFLIAQVLLSSYKKNMFP